MNKILVLALAMSLTFSLAAQESSYLVNDKNHVFLGPLVQGNIIGIANQNNYGFSEMDYMIPFGFSAGVVLGKEWSRKDRLELALQYSSAGQSYRMDQNMETLKKKVQLQYLQLPVMYKRAIYYMTDTKAEYLINVGMGLQMGYLTSADIEWQRGDENLTMLSFLTQNPNPRAQVISDMLTPSGQPTSYDDLFQSYDVGGLMSLGIIYKTNLKWMLELELRGYYGFTDINKEEWRLENRKDMYGASRNISGGLRVAFLYTIWD